MLDDEDDERKSLELAIALGLAELSGVETPPSEVDVRTEFDAESVRFDNNSWLERIVRVQDWLRLAARLDPEDSSSHLAAQLFHEIGTEPSVIAFESEDGAIRLTPPGLERLRDRVDRAVNLKDKYMEDLVVTDSIAAATAGWIDSWDEVIEEPTNEPVVAKASTWPIFEFAGRAERGRLNLSPSYQRGDVWPTRDAQLLIESILRGIPLPSVIILKPKADDASFEVVDGKQRLTSILRFMGAHPDAVARVKEKSKLFPSHRLEELFQTDYVRFRRAWKNATGETLSSNLEREYYFPFKLSTTSSALKGELEPLRGKYYFAIKDHRLRVGGERVEVRDIFEATTEYKVPVIEYTEATRRQIHDVFNLYNKQGKHLNAEEIRNALYHDVQLMRALSVAAGDNRNLGEVAPFLESIREEVVRISELLNEYRFGDVRYRRTKVLSWLFSLLFVDSIGSDGQPRMLSTAQQINWLLTRIETTSDDPFRAPAKIRASLLLVKTAMEAHSSIDDAWAPKFKDNSSGVKWQELQLIASLLGVAMATVVLNSGTESRLIQHEQGLHEQSTSNWLRPLKTQTATQWQYIARVALSILEELHVSANDVDTALLREFGFSSVPSLEAIRGGNAGDRR